MAPAVAEMSFRPCTVPAPATAAFGVFGPILFAVTPALTWLQGCQGVSVHNFSSTPQHECKGWLWSSQHSTTQPTWKGVYVRSYAHAMTNLETLVFSHASKDMFGFLPGKDGKVCIIYCIPFLSRPVVRYDGHLAFLEQ